MPVGLDIEERRSLPREPLRFPARLRGAPEGIALQCFIEEMTINGARIVAENTALPKEFTILLDAHGSMTRRCKVIWRSGFAAGVKFQPKT